MMEFMDMYERETTITITTQTWRVVVDNHFSFLGHPTESLLSDLSYSFLLLLDNNGRENVEGW
ncbi:hypothetical protein CHS0354_004682 [Potamilus streckersoni]|uniref:Uncharacterized protein n=1 Tax=Potamilus streckersoni TaxID=2493646 RepID=A0AAE0SB53_9BIVA|nr:hypothetical protein CHS0354_004682 [Potamilus streckersoni]